VIGCGINITSLINNCPRVATTRLWMTIAIIWHYFKITHNLPSTKTYLIHHQHGPTMLTLNLIQLSKFVLGEVAVAIFTI
jgi:hypothetical protein